MQFSSELPIPVWGLLPIATGLFVGLPLCLYFDAGWTPVLSLVGMMYAAATFVLACLWRLRTRLTLRAGILAALTFESLVCLPCALNVLRKASTRIHMAEDLLDVARPRLSAARCGPRPSRSCGASTKGSTPPRPAVPSGGH